MVFESGVWFNLVCNKMFVVLIMGCNCGCFFLWIYLVICEVNLVGFGIEIEFVVDFICFWIFFKMCWVLLIIIWWFVWEVIFWSCGFLSSLLILGRWCRGFCIVVLLSEMEGYDDLVIWSMSNVVSGFLFFMIFMFISILVFCWWFKSWKVCFVCEYCWLVDF